VAGSGGTGLTSQATTGAAPGEARSLVIRFDDNRLVPLLYGGYDENLARIEQTLGVTLSSRGNQVTVTGPADAAATAATALRALYRRLERGLPVDRGEVDAAVRLAAEGDAGAPGGTAEDVAIRLPRRLITPRSAGQRRYVRALMDSDLVFALGPAGTGKTYLAVAMAVAMLSTGRIDRIILCRPAVEAGERLGFLPGDLREKIDPYLRPLFDSLYDMLPADQVARRLSTGEIEVAPLAFMRGRTLSNAFIILDEAQNTSRVQMKMILTRMGENARMAVTGDLSQIDLPRDTESGLRHAVRMVGHITGVTMVRFSDADVVRHALVSEIVRAYEAEERAGTPEEP